jgi:GTP-binding protein HflX
LASADVLVEDKLFATLDPTTRKVTMPGGREVLFTDTVGFIQKLPPDIVAAFRATLEEITEADILLHVVDATHPDADAQIESVEDILAELEVDQLPTVMALNKIDLLPKGAELPADLPLGHVAVPISALTGEGIPNLLLAIEGLIEGRFARITVRLPYSRGDLLSMFHERGQLESEQHEANGILLTGRLPQRLLAYFEAYRLED